MKSILRPLALAAAVAAFHSTPLHAQDAPADGAPQVFLDKSPKIVAYQLKRLSNAQLLAVGRKTDDPKYKPVYTALLTRKGIDRKIREEAVAALVKLNASDPVAELLTAVGGVEDDDKATPHELVALLMAQKPEVLTKQRDKIQALTTESDKDLVKQSAYAALATADGKPDVAWKAASDADGGLKLLLTGLPMIADGKVRGAFFPLVKPLAAKAPDDATQAAAIEALGSTTGHEAEAFALLSDLIKSGPGPRRDAAVRAVRRIPAASWPADQVAPLAAAVVDAIRQTPADQRTTPSAVGAVQLGNDLAAALPPDKGLPIRKTIRGLAAQTVVLGTLREQMLFDQRYFVVQAGKPVQVVLENADAMPHNFVLTAPGALQEVATAGQNIQPTGVPGEKPFVPPGPKVLTATPLVQPDESASINFVAPAKAGEYPFVCTFPGHWVRMYGTMLVVDDVDAWEQAPKPPNDPITHKPFAKQKTDPAEAQPDAHQHS